MEINPEHESFYITQYQEAFLKNVENEYCAKHRCAPVNKPETVPCSNLVHSSTASGSYQSHIDSYDLPSENEEYLTPNNEAQTTPGRSDHADSILTTASLYLNSPPEAPKNWGNLSKSQ